MTVTWRLPHPELAPIAAAGALDRWAARVLRGMLGPLPVRIALWDGSEVALGDGTPRARMRFRSRRALLEVALDPERRVGEAYRAGRFEVDGDLVWLLAEVYRALGSSEPRRSRRPRRGHTRRVARHNVHHHYDLGEDFYRLWLDEQLLYTCAYFPRPDASLEAAQEAKLERVCRKLWLRPGERVVEAGCGWGALALHMARRHGASVRAYNVSREQVRYARRRAAREGLSGRVEFVEEDYRDIRGRFDVFVSLGMLEHVGRARYRSLAAVIDRVLPERGGRGLLHFIGRDQPQELNPWIRRRIFPGAYAPTLSEVTDGVLRPAGLSVLDVENLRLHYERTLAHWLARFESHADRVSELFDDAFTRTWRFYLAGSQAAFRVGALQLFQVSFARSGDDAIAWTRDDLLPPAAARDRGAL